ncbi:MAG: hypothetical protein J3K34DRAFT_520141, partial [Monoraphidium minutum]
MRPPTRRRPTRTTPTATTACSAPACCSSSSTEAGAVRRRPRQRGGAGHGPKRERAMGPRPLALSVTPPPNNTQNMFPQAARGAPPCPGPSFCRPPAPLAAPPPPGSGPVERRRRSALDPPPLPPPGRGAP